MDKSGCGSWMSDLWQESNTLVSYVQTAPRVTYQCVSQWNRHNYGVTSFCDTAHHWIGRGHCSNRGLEIKGNQGSQVFCSWFRAKGMVSYVALVARPSGHDLALVFIKVQESFIASLLKLLFLRSACRICLSWWSFHHCVDFGLISKQFPTELEVPKKVINEDNYDRCLIAMLMAQFLAFLPHLQSFWRMMPIGVRVEVSLRLV